MLFVSVNSFSLWRIIFSNTLSKALKLEGEFLAFPSFKMGITNALLKCFGKYPLPKNQLKIFVINRKNEIAIFLITTGEIQSILGPYLFLKLFLFNITSFTVFNLR